MKVPTCLTVAVAVPTFGPRARRVCRKDRHIDADRDRHPHSTVGEPGVSPVGTTTAAPQKIILPEVAGQNAEIVRKNLEKLGLTDVSLSSSNPKYTVVVLASKWTAVSIESPAGSRRPAPSSRRAIRWSSRFTRTDLAMTDTAAATSLPTSRKVLCVAYGAIAVAALISTWSQNIAYLHAGIARYFADFLAGVKVTSASRCIACDIVFFFLAAGVFMVIEAHKRGIRFVWAYIVAGILIDISVAFPLFLIARELRLGASEEPRLRAVDTVLLIACAAAAVALAIAVDR